MSNSISKLEKTNENIRKLIKVTAKLEKANENIRKLIKSLASCRADELQGKCPIKLYRCNTINDDYCEEGHCGKCKREYIQDYIENLELNYLVK